MNTAVLLKCPLFKGFTQEELNTFLTDINSFIKEYDKNETIYHSGTCIQSLGIVIEGSVQIEKNDYWGNKSILDVLGSGQVFAETYALMETEPLMVDVISTQKSRILFLNINNASKSDLYTKILTNLLRVSTKKNLILSRRITFVSAKSTRDRLLTFLSYQSAVNKSSSFDIQLNRQQLADYLNVERSAMCAELSRMQNDGLIKYEKNHFTLVQNN